MAVMYWLAQNDAEKTAAQWTLGVTLIMVIGALAVLLLVFFAVLRRSATRQKKAIEQDKAERRSMRSSGRVDAWSAGSDRYVDHDKLPDEVPFGSDEGAEEDLDDFGPDTRQGPGMGEDDEPLYEDGREERDPFGLFDDKPYQESEDPDDEDLDDEDGFDDEFDDDDDDDDDDDEPGR